METIFYKLFEKMIPIHEKRIVYMSYNGKYTDSPKYLYNFFKNKRDYENIWLVNNDLVLKLRENGIKAYDINSFKGHYYYGSANIIIDNVYGRKESFLKSTKNIDKIIFKIKTWINYKTNQKVYTFWHGTPIKKMGRDEVNSDIVDFNCPNTTMILGDKYTLDIMQHMTFNKIKMHLSGSPRIENLMQYNKNEIKNKLGIEEKQKVILYAPSFRSDGDASRNIYRSGINQLNEIDFDKLFTCLNQKFNGNWVFICRFHYHVASLVDWDEIKRKYGNRIINGNELEDINEYLSIADLLVSDVSSCMFEYAYMKKPIFSYFPDYEYYKSAERGMYVDIKELPFSLSENFDELIESITNYNDDGFVKRVNEMQEKLGCVDFKNATEEAYKYIINDRK